MTSILNLCQTKVPSCTMGSNLFLFINQVSSIFRQSSDRNQNPNLSPAKEKKKTMQNKTMQNKTKQNKTNKTKQNKSKQNKTKQNKKKTRQNKTKKRKKGTLNLKKGLYL